MFFLDSGGSKKEDFYISFLEGTVDLLSKERSQIATVTTLLENHLPKETLTTIGKFTRRSIESTVRHANSPFSFHGRRESRERRGHADLSSVRSPILFRNPRFARDKHIKTRTLIRGIKQTELCRR